MKIYTASFFEPEVHGPGRKIGIAPSKPKNLLEDQGYDCDFCHDYLSPEQIYWDYHRAKKAANGDEDLLRKAGDDFVDAYKQRLNEFKENSIKEAESSNKSVFAVIGLEEGDTLLSWEKGGHTSFRPYTAECLRELGYEVEER